MTWTPEERLRVVAVLLARKRHEAMGTIPLSPINYEAMLGIAVGPVEMLREIEPRLEEYLADAPDDLWAEVEQDIRKIWPPAQWPAWLRRDPA